MREIYLDKEKIFSFLDGLFRIQVGEGDLSTELVEPYGKYAEFGIYVGEEVTVFGLSLLQEWILDRNRDINPEIKVSDGEKAQPNRLIMVLKGNGKSIITLFEFLNPILSGLSRLYEFGMSVISRMEEFGYEPVVANEGDPCYALLRRYALEKCGFRLLYSSVEDSVFIRPVHIEWVGDERLLLDNIEEQLGGKSHGFRVQVEVNSPEQFAKLNENDFWRIHLRGLSPEEIKTVLKNARYTERIVVHVDNLDQLENLNGLSGIRWICPDIFPSAWDKKIFKIGILKEER